MSKDEKRMAGDYEIIEAISIGKQEIVLGENQNESEGKKYICANCTQNELMASYSEVLASDDYAELVAVFGERVKCAAEEVYNSRKLVRIPLDVIPAEHCFPNDYRESLVGLVVALKSNCLRREYRTADRQIWRVDGGFGAEADARGSAVFCTNVYTGKTARWERSDIQGEIKPENMPTWVKEKMAIEKKSKERGAR